MHVHLHTCIHEFVYTHVYMRISLTEHVQLCRGLCMCGEGLLLFQQCYNEMIALNPKPKTLRPKAVCCLGDGWGRHGPIPYRQ